MPSATSISPAAQIVLLAIWDANRPVTRSEIYQRIERRLAEKTVGSAIHALKSEGLIHICEWRVERRHRLAVYKAGPGLNVTYEAKYQKPEKPVFIPRPDPAAAWMRNEIPEEV